MNQLPIIQPRSCGDCTLCCKLMGIMEITKQPGLWCPHCQPRGGCMIYQDRPKECREYMCMWLMDNRGVFTEGERPDRLKAVFNMGEITPYMQENFNTTDIKACVHVVVDHIGQQNTNPLKKTIDKFLNQGVAVVVIHEKDYREFIMPARQKPVIKGY